MLALSNLGFGEPNAPIEDKDSKSEPAVGSQKKRAVRKNDSTVKHGAVAEFRLQLRRFLAFSEANARRHNLTSQQYQALLTIKGLSLPHQHMSVGELADFLLIKRYTAGRLISGMTGTGFFEALSGWPRR